MHADFCFVAPGSAIASEGAVAASAQDQRLGLEHIQRRPDGDAGDHEAPGQIALCRQAALAVKKRHPQSVGDLVIERNGSAALKRRPADAVTGRLNHLATPSPAT